MAIESEPKNRVLCEHLEYRDDGLYYYKGKPFTGVEVFEENGRLEGEQEHRQGLKWGLKRSYHRSGAIEEEAECAWGAYHGAVHKWHDNRQLAFEGQYEYGICIHVQEWDEGGNLTVDYTIDPSEHARVQLYRCAFGDPRRPIPFDKAWLSWNGSTVVMMAQAISDTGGFDRMPILADALTDAGCTNHLILEHCRTCDHVPHCWVLRVLLGLQALDE